ncbi:MAG: DUF433 domain-containing protein [Ignavibacteriales bacterium]|nr:DUF433 domain-containing protein [Ignavibacteriales bacterium]
MGGVACIRNLRMPVDTILAMLAEGCSEQKIIEEHPELKLEDIRAALSYATICMRVRELPTENIPFN